MEFEICEEFAERWSSNLETEVTNANHAPGWAARRDRGQRRQRGVSIPEEGSFLAQPDLVQQLAA